MSNPLQRLAGLGQSVWLDFIDRDFLRQGELRRLIHEDGVSGLTSNPVIFAKAIGQHAAYDDAIHRLVRGGADLTQVYEALVVEDIVAAADMLRPVYDGSQGRDGFVSLEISPHLSADTEGSYREAMHLWSCLDRPNVMIKLPATRESLPAIRRLLADGVNVNVTLIFGLRRYDEVLNAFLDGLEQRHAAGQDISGVASVASFFLSRIDSLVDVKLDALKTETARDLRGELAVACARLAYQQFLQCSRSSRWQQLHALGAQPQRLLWASTGVKDRSYPDTRYVEPLIGPHTVTTLPLETLAAYRQRGEPAVRIEQQLDHAHEVLEQLRELGVDADAVAQQLEVQGIRKFIEPFDALLRTLAAKMQATSAGA